MKELVFLLEERSIQEVLRVVVPPLVPPPVPAPPVIQLQQ